MVVWLVPLIWSVFFVALLATESDPVTGALYSFLKKFDILCLFEILTFSVFDRECQHFEKKSTGPQLLCLLLSVLCKLQQLPQQGQRLQNDR